MGTTVALRCVICIFLTELADCCATKWRVGGFVTRCINTVDVIYDLIDRQIVGIDRYLTLGKVKRSLMNSSENPERVNDRRFSGASN